jgi:hypothetical protein
MKTFLCTGFRLQGESLWSRHWLPLLRDLARKNGQQQTLKTGAETALKTGAETALKTRAETRAETRADFARIFLSYF